MRKTNTLLLSLVLLLTTACATTPSTRPSSVPSVQRGSEEEAAGEEVSQLISQMRSDLSRYRALEVERRGVVSPKRSAQQSRPAPAVFESRPSVTKIETYRSLRMPIVGLSPHDLDDNFGQPREGGKRKHRGIDIFARRGAEIVAVADGYISYIGEQPKGGRCIWLSSESGVSFYYAHLDRWAAGLYEGMEVNTGDLLGYVGTTGNAAHTPPHLHFQIVENDDPVNPYPLLRGASIIVTARSRGILTGGFQRQSSE